jgi:Tetracyclin repressor-like, C-terminal domain
MDGLWRATRQEGFTRLATRLATVRATSDPVRDLAALGSAYLSSAMESPDLYRVMFDTTADLEDTASADAQFEPLVQAAQRARAVGRFRVDVDPLGLATQTWAIGHGLASLVVTGPLPPATLAYAEEMLTALYVHAGDDAVRCRRSVARGWDLAPG